MIGEWVRECVVEQGEYYMVSRWICPWILAILLGKWFICWSMGATGLTQFWKIMVRNDKRIKRGLIGSE